ncbi:MAG: response regulator [Nitrosomonadales bacterium]|nr:MAG: response regulator [Nitrosomonadales bacterium]
MNFSIGASELSVYLVEPSTTQARFISTKLAELGIQHIKIFKDGATALAAMRDHQPNLTISSMHNKGMSGSELVEKMRADDDLKGVAFILITSEEDHHLLESVRQAGACAMLPKPFATEQLRTAISSALDYLNMGSLKVGGGDIEIDNLRILVVDDSSSSRSYISHILETIGIHHITLAENGKQAVEIIAEQLFDVVLTDYNMAEMDGKELVEFIRGKSWQSSVPIIMISSETNKERLAAVKKAGVSAICGKPFDAPHIKSILEQVLAQREN